jgi:hypothetical protein
VKNITVWRTCCCSCCETAPLPFAFAVMMAVVVDARGDRNESAGSITLLRLADDDDDFLEAPMARDSAMTWRRRRGEKRADEEKRIEKECVRDIYSR